MITFNKPLNLQLNLNEQQDSETLPEVSVFVFGENEQCLRIIDAKHQDNIALDQEELAVVDRIVVATRSSALTESIQETAITYNRSQLFQLNELGVDLDISRDDWIGFLPLFRTCISGTVSKCSFRFLLPGFFTSNVSTFNPVIPRRPLVAQALTTPSALTPFPLFRCNPICEGVVEVFERTCCRRNVFIPDLIPDLCEIIKREIPELERVPEIPPIPGPDPIPFEFFPIVENGAVNELRLNAARDFNFLSNASPSDAVPYIEARPYLMAFLETCSTPVSRGVTALGENGNFTLCYNTPPIFVAPSISLCRKEYSFKVTQFNDGGPTVIYDGVRAGNWFDKDEDIDLVTYLSSAVDCDPETEIPDPGERYVSLEKIGSGGLSYDLDSPDQRAAFEVDTLSPISGLARPESDLELAKGVKRNLNWGGSLGFRLQISESMREVGAMYYRVGIRACSDSGFPTSAVKYLTSAVTWFYTQPVVEEGVLRLKRRAQNLTDPNNPEFHRIPYLADLPANSTWNSGQFHAFWNTLDDDLFIEPGRYMMSIELFNENMQRVIPDNVLSGGLSSDDIQPFSYHRWTEQTSTQPVPFEALTHVLWVDNRGLTAVLEDFIVNNTPSSNECQFLEGVGSDQFGVGFRAFHPQHGPGQPDFLLHWNLYWSRGLGNNLERLDNGGEGVGIGASNHASATESFQTLLTNSSDELIDPPRCTFSVVLNAGIKTWNGSTFIDEGSLKDVGSFALEIN